MRYCSVESRIGRNLFMYLPIIMVWVPASNINYPTANLQFAQVGIDKLKQLIMFTNPIICESVQNRSIVA